MVYTSKLIAQINIETYFIGMVSIVQGSLQRAEHTIHSVCYGTTEHAFFLQDVLDLVAAQSVIPG